MFANTRTIGDKRTRIMLLMTRLKSYSNGSDDDDDDDDDGEDYNDSCDEDGFS